MWKRIYRLCNTDYNIVNYIKQSLLRALSIIFFFFSIVKTDINIMVHLILFFMAIYFFLKSSAGDSPIWSSQLWPVILKFVFFVCRCYLPGSVYVAIAMVAIIVAYFKAILKIVDLDMRPFTGGNNDFSAYCWKTVAGLYIMLGCSCIFFNNILRIVNARIHKILAGLSLENLSSCATGCIAACIGGHYLVVPVKLHKTIPID